MKEGSVIRPIRLPFVAALVVVGVLLTSVAFAADVSMPFAGKDVNHGTVTHAVRNGTHVLTLSRDVDIPGTPDPHWQVVDSKGNVYLLDRLKLHEDKINWSIKLPRYIPDVAKVQMWCAWAEVLLGEARFPKPVTAYKK
jgi:hypothetical protein